MLLRFSLEEVCIWIVNIAWNGDQTTMVWNGDQTTVWYGMGARPQYSTAWYGDQTTVLYGMGTNTMVLCLGEEVSMLLATRLHTSATAFPLDFAFSSFLLAAS